MALAPGSRLGAYEIASLIGVGGMGEVYRAHDTKLGRDVAIKILPPTFTEDPDRIARLRREAHMLAALNHPHINAIYGIDEADGQQFLVLELIEGETLAHRLARGILRIPEAVAIARQIAAALESAHDKGIIHRDLKPANVALTSDGLVKLLDFGLAKASDPPSGASDPTKSPAASSSITTRVGVIVGTAAYMSPEQAIGRPADKRSDIWAFGCVLFEMLTGVSAFDATTTTEVRAAVRRGDPPWTALAPGTPPSLRTLVKFCLESDPKNRLQHMGDARLFLDAALAEVALPVADIGRRPRWLVPVAISAVAALALAGGFAIARLLGPREAPSVTRFAMTPPSGLKPGLAFGPSVAVSPDGRTLVYALETGTTTQLYIKQLDELEARPFGGTQGARSPFFSPLGQWVGFYDEDDRKLKKVSTRGGEPVTITDAAFPGSAVWAPDDTILFASNQGLVRVPAAGGTPEPVVKSEKREYRWPALLPGGRVALYTRLPERGGYDQADIVALRLADGGTKVVLKSAYFPQYAPTGHLIFVQGDSVLAAPFNPESLEVTGPAVTVLKDVWISSWTGYADFAFSDTGTLIYVSGGPHPTRATLVAVDRAGSETAIIDEPRAYRVPRVSPDGKQVAVTLVDQQVDVWTYDLARKRLNRLTDSPSWDAYPFWQPDMRWIAFSSTRDGLASLYRQDLRDGTVEKLIGTEYPIYPDSWSPDGKRLAYEEENAETGLDIWIYSMESRSRQVFLRTPYNELHAEFSPDGRFIAYESGEAGGQTEVYVRPYPDINPRRKVSTNGGAWPRWRTDGKELFYRVGGKVMALNIETTPDLVPGTPRELFDGPYGQYDVLPNGQFVIVKEMAAGDPPTRINLVLHWFEELKRLTSATR